MGATEAPEVGRGFLRPSQRIADAYEIGAMEAPEWQALMVEKGTKRFWGSFCGFHGFFELKLGNGTQQLPWLGRNPLAMDHVAGVVISHRAGQRCE